MTARSLLTLLPLALGACNCGESTAAPHPLDPPAAAVSPSLALAARCREILTPKDVKEVCGADVVTGRSDGKWDCELTFERSEDDRSRLRVAAVNELSSKQAQARYGRLANQAERQKKMRTVKDVGDAAHMFYRTYGKGEGFRRMNVLDSVHKTYVTRIRVPHHREAKPVCDADAIPKLAKLIDKRLLQDSAPPAP